MSFDPGADADEVAEAVAREENQTRDLLEKILKVLLRMEVHLQRMTDEEITDDDVD